MLGLIIGLIFVAVVLLFIEVFLIPGFTISGILSIISFVLAIYLSYSYYNASVGNIVLIISSLFLIVFFIFVTRHKTWKKAVLTTNIDSSIVQKNLSQYLNKKGKTLTRLNPTGKIIVENEILEAKSELNIIEPNVEVEIIKIEDQNLIVKPLKT
ncbi:MAG: hypothetical protein N3A01_00510 [Bacteroidales bacterium]|nr:hypothetical protein [Bacteroidales bacterium]